MRRPLALLVATAALLLAAAPQALAARGDVTFPRGFLWGTANAGFQYEAGGSPSNADRGSDWWVWSHDPTNIAKHWVTGDRVERSAGHWRVWRGDLDLARRGLRSNAYRTGIEWSRIFPRSTAGVRTGSRITASPGPPRRPPRAAPLPRRTGRHPRARDAHVPDGRPLHAAALDPRPDRHA